MQGYPYYINNTIDNQPFPRLKDGAINIMKTLFNQNLSIKLSSCLQVSLIQIPNVI